MGTTTTKQLDKVIRDLNDIKERLCDIAQDLGMNVNGNIIWNSADDVVKVIGSIAQVRTIVRINEDYNNGRG